MCKEQGPPNYMFIHIYVTVYMYIKDLSNTGHRCWAQPGLGDGAHCHA